MTENLWADAKYISAYRCAVETLKVSPSLGQPSRLAQEGDILITSVEAPQVTQSPVLLIFNESNVVAYRLTGHAWQPLWVEVPDADSRRPSHWYYLRYRHSLLFKSEYEDFRKTSAPATGFRNAPLSPSETEKLKPERILLLAVAEKLDEIESNLKTGFRSRRDLLLGNLSLCQNMRTSAQDLALKVQERAADLFERSPRFDRTPAGF